MNILEKALLWTLYSSFIATIMAIFILVIRKLFKNYISPRLQHALWFLILIKLLLPISVGNPLNLVDTVPESYKNIIDYKKDDLSKSLDSKESKDSLKKDIRGHETDDISIFNNSNNVTNTKKEQYENTLKSKYLKVENLLYEFKEQEKDSIEKIIKISSYIWITGFSVMAIFVLSITFKFKNNAKQFYKSNNLHIDHMLEVSKDKLGLNKNISIYYNDEFRSPFIYGILNPKIYIPKNVLDMATEQELLHIILHELTHYKRKDLLSNIFSILAILFHWFNPVIWFAMKKMREDRELACDSYILDVLEEHESVQYGMTILNFSKNFLNSSYKNNLNLCFYESKTQIERRIMMIRKFKKGSYKMSAVSIILLTLSGSVALAGGGGNIVNPTIGVSANQNLEEKDDKDLKLYFNDETFSFNTLDRASDFIDFKFKVPDYLPQGVKLISINLNRNKDNIIDMFFMKERTLEGSFSFFISKENLIEDLKNRHKNKSDETSDVTVNYKEEPLSISNVQGKNLTVTSNITNKVGYEVTPEGVQRRIKKITEATATEEYFIWSSENIWYAIGHDSSSGISKNDIEKMVTSLKDPEDVSKDKYTSKRPDEIEIYDKKDLTKAEELLGFEPKLSLNLAEGFVAIGAKLQKDEYGDQIASQGPTGKLAMSTTYTQNDSSSSTWIWFDQGKNTFIYDSLEEKVRNGIDDSIDQERYTTKRSRTTSMEVNGIKVFTSTEVDAYDPNEPILQVNYIWKKDDIVYRIFMRSKLDDKIDNHEAIIKALMR